MFIMKFLNNKKGQALVEAALIAPLIVFFLFTIIWFGRIMLTWQQISGAARYGTDLIAYTPFSKQYIKNEIKDYLCNNLTVGRTLNRDLLNVDVNIKDLDAPIDLTVDGFIEDIIKEPDSILKKLETIWAVIDPQNITDTHRNKSYVEITYKYETPPIASWIRRDIIIKARSEVLADTGSQGSKLTASDRAARK